MVHDPRARAFSLQGVKPLTTEQMIELRAELVARLDIQRRRRKPVKKAWLVYPPGEKFRPFLVVDITKLRDDQSAPLLRELGDGLEVTVIHTKQADKIAYLRRFKKELLWQSSRPKRKKT